jgi:hypothetical protein
LPAAGELILRLGTDAIRIGPSLRATSAPFSVEDDRAEVELLLVAGIERDAPGDPRQGLEHARHLIVFQRDLGFGDGGDEILAGRNRVQRKTRAGCWCAFSAQRVNRRATHAGRSRTG